MKIIMLRHLKTLGNEKGQYIGSTDEELSLHAVEEFHSKNREYPCVQRLVVSPMKRCIQSAKLMYPHISMVEDSRLRECCFGKFEQKTYEELKEEPEYLRWLDSGGNIPFPEGEDPKKFRERCVQAIKDSVHRFLEEDVHHVAFVVHGGTIMAALAELAEGSHNFYDWQVKNGEGFLMIAKKEEWQSGKEIFREVEKI
ncbi:MAG: histidine phosphatase family protein [Candidatus Ruminococcus intestinipullorum]|nr:histidine phosphatase family protein [Candidatus Ruminococcus intestinipullorum]